MGGYEFNSSEPIYQQIMAKIRMNVMSGEWPPGEKIQSVRELAAAFQVNPNTMQRALNMLEYEGVLQTERTVGRYVTRDTDKIRAMKEEAVASLISGCRQQLRRLGYSNEEISAIFKKEE